MLYKTESSGSNPEWIKYLDFDKDTPLYEFDAGTIKPTDERGQIIVDGNEVPFPHRESISAVRKIGQCSSGYHTYEFTDVAETIEKLSDAGHRVTVTKKTIRQHGDDWDVPSDISLYGDRYPEDWGQRRKCVYQRDDYTCQRCGDTNVEVHAHHKTPISDGGSHELQNLETLCRPCHEKIHK